MTKSREEIIKAWGDTPSFARKIHDFEHYLMKTLPHWTMTETMNSGDLVKMFNADAVICMMYAPRPSTEKPEMLSIYPDRKCFDQGPRKRLRGKPGRMLMRMFPWLASHQLEVLVDYYRETYITTSDAYTLYSGSKAGDFIRAYSHEQAPMANPNTTWWRKSSSSSCMRYDFEHLDVHPVACYASGDFTMLWTETSDGRIASRCVIRNDPCVASFIYGVSEGAMNVLEAELKKRGAIYGASADNGWIGAKLNAHENGKGAYYAPYLDLEPRRVEHVGKHLVILEDGAISACDYEGLLNGTPFCCCDCGSGMDHDSVLFGPDTEDTYCEDCFNTNYFHCEYYEEYYHNSERNEVFVDWRGMRSTEYWCDAAVEANAVLVKDGSLWCLPNTEQLPDKSYITTKQFEEDYFISDYDNKIYHNDDMVVLADGGVCTQGQAEDAGLIENTETSEWEALNEAA
jgi:hypothetical protein